MPFNGHCYFHRHTDELFAKGVQVAYTYVFLKFYRTHISNKCIRAEKRQLADNGLRLGCEFWPGHSLTTDLGAGYLTSLGLSFPICKMDSGVSDVHAFIKTRSCFYESCMCVCFQYAHSCCSITATLLQVTTVSTYYRHEFFRPLSKPWRNLLEAQIIILM